MPDDLVDPALDAEIRGHIARHGSMSYAAFVEFVLYHPSGGFYASGGRAGRQGDFLTSPEVGPLFGAVLARALDAWWEELGRPDPFVVVEGGAGIGTLALGVRAASPRCAPALHYVLVERSDVLRQRQGDHLPLVAPPFALGPREGPDPDAAHSPGTGPTFTSLPGLPGDRLAHVVWANELLDNLPFHVLRRGVTSWDEVVVGLDASGGFCERVVPARDDLVALARASAPDAAVGAEIPVQLAAADWIRSAIDLVPEGRVVVIDYAALGAELAERPDRGWLRTFRGHDAGAHPLASPGSQDVTSDVDLTQLARVRPPTRVRSQREFLESYGIDDLVAEGKRIWTERAHIGDLEALRARSRVREAEALCEVGGLGAFRVVEWELGAPRRRPVATAPARRVP